MVKVKKIIFFFLSIVTGTSFSQTGPAGVGTSAVNVFWIKADAGTSSTVNGNTITAWNDQSGNGINVTQTVAVQQPSFATNVLNGYPGVQFDNNNVSGQNDFMLAPDNSKLDNTPGYSFFTVSKMNFLTTEARCIVSKRTSVDIDEAFMLFYYTGNSFYTDIDGIGDRNSTNPVTYSTGVGNIMDVVYTGSLTTSLRTKIYEGETLRKTFKDSSSLVPDKISPLNIGCTHSADNRPFGGYINEVIIYTVTVNDAQRIIVNNYLSAKYNIALSANDKYVGDMPANGDYDKDVAGVGKESTGSNPSFSASISGGLTIANTSGLDNGDYIIAGHASPTNAQILYDVGGMTGINNARWLRIWYFDITNTATALTNDIEFDMSDGGVGAPSLSTASNYVLLYRAGQAGNWTELVTANSIVGDRIIFTGYTLTNDGYYTIGTRNYLVSPLPIELLSFDAVKNDKKVDITWATSSEKDNAYFTVEKSKDAISFEPLTHVNAAGNTNSIAYYAEADQNPYNGLSYYRLKQTEKTGTYTYSNPVAVNYTYDDEGITIFPNPSEGDITLNINGLVNKEIAIVIRDVLGRDCFSKVMMISDTKQFVTLDPETKLSAGVYIVIASTHNKLYSQKLIVK